MEAASARAVSERRDAERESAAAPSGPRAERSEREAWNEIFARLAAGERDALGALYDLAAKRLYGLALWRTGSAADAEEVVQEVFVRIAERHEELGAVRDPQAWLLAVARRAAIDHVRRRRVRSGEPLERCDLLVAPAAAPERQLDAARASRELVNLPPAQREVLYLRHFAGLTFAAIAELVRAPLFTVASRHRLGLARLRKRLEETER